MGFWQSLVESYEKNSDALKKLYPLSTTSISNNSDMIVIVVIDGEGNFLRSEIIEKRTNYNKKSSGNPLKSISIPVTEESMGRSSGISPHPVFDQYEYLKGDGEKYNAYIENLKNFAESQSSGQIKAIYQYISKRTITKDLKNIGLKDKTIILFQVEIANNLQQKVWEDESFFNEWHNYYLDLKKKRAEEKQNALQELESKELTAAEKKQLKSMAQVKDRITLDYITGNERQPIANFHPKKISIIKAANAKIISDNDTTNYTFKGKFEDSSQALAIGYESSQKAHQFLRYLINERGYYCGEQVIVSFTIGSTEKLLPPPIEENSIFAAIQGTHTKTENDMKIELRNVTGFDYSDALRKALGSSKYSGLLGKHPKTAVIVLDAATTGRLSITFYRELERSEYLEKIADWHKSCKWHQKFWDKDNEKNVLFTGAPSIDKIIEAVYGKKHSGKDESYTKIQKTARERLIRCIFDGSFIPQDYVVAAIRRATNPLGITMNGSFDRNGFEKIVSTACALVRKNYIQRKEEEYKLSVELERTDRDYLYGRLLGAADKLEERALKKKEKNRATAAIRHMQAFAQHPFRTWQTIHNCLNPYIQNEKNSFAFTEIQNIKKLFITGEYEDDTPLNGSYLIGYYHERAHIEDLIKSAGEKKKLNDSIEKEKSDV